VNKARVLKNVIPAFENLAGGLEELKGSGVNDGGLSNFDKGKLYYEYLMKSDIGTGKSMDDLIYMTDDRLDTLLYGIIYIIQNNESVWDTWTNPDFGTEDPEEIIQMLIKGMADHYPPNTGANHTLKSVHPSLEGSSPPAFYMNLPIDDFSDAVIYINESAVRNDALFATLAHEGYPGHLYQDTYFKNKEMHPLRKVMSSMGYIEGWATYVELNAFSLTYIPGMEFDTALLLSYDEEFGLAIQSRCDLGVNYEGWTMNEIRDYLSGFGIDDEGSCRDIYEYVAGNPAKTLRYFLGFMELTELSDYASEKLGDAFWLIDFHECLLDVGPAPFFIVKEAVDDYIRVVQ